MKTLFFAVFACVLLPTLAHAHIGSPNVFFEGNAGPHPVRVIIRPPATLPGIAQVDVRSPADGVTRVLIQSTFWEAGEQAAPEAIRANAVAGDGHLFNAPVWLLRSGSYSLRVTVESALGSGSVLVPLNSSALERAPMPPLLAAILIALGVLLSASAVVIVGAAARDCSREPDAPPTIRDRVRGRKSAIAMAFLLTAAISGGAIRWQKMDREFRNNALFKPLPVEASVHTNGTLHLLRLTAPSGSAGSWDTLVADHGKLMHLFLIREPDGKAFAHLHPVRRNSKIFEAVIPALPGGTYQLYAEITHENGLNQTLVAKVELETPLGPALQMGWSILNAVWCQSPALPGTDSPQPYALDADDSWHVDSTSTTVLRSSFLLGGGRMTFQESGTAIANREMSLRFAVSTPDGKPALLQPYMGMLGHAVVRRAGGEVFTHLHPAGTFSMAAEEMLASRERQFTAASATAPEANLSNPAGASTNEVAFPYAFPRPGDYRMWVQVRVDGQIVTGVFEIAVGSD